MPWPKRTSYASDDYPELIKAAAPFGLKLTESLLAENPQHLGLLTSAASGFTQYSYAFVQEDADEVEPHDFAAAEAMRVRARHLYLRAQKYGLRGLNKGPRLREGFAGQSQDRRPHGHGIGCAAALLDGGSVGFGHFPFQGQS